MITAPLLALALQALPWNYQTPAERIERAIEAVCNWWTPPVDVKAELIRFPSKAAADAATKLNWEFERHLECIRDTRIDRRPIQGAIKENERLRRAWYLLYWAAYYANEGDCHDFARHELEELRGMIGDEAYFLGLMPPPVPLEYFTELD